MVHPQEKVLVTVGRVAVVVGATGLVGSHLVEHLCRDDHYEAIHLPVRKIPEGFTKHNKIRVEAVDFHQIDTWRSLLAGDHFFCCLGTTIKLAGSKEKFRYVDHDLPLALAKEALSRGCNHAAVVSALGADPKSSVFYNQVKGETERDLAELDFQALHLLRPSLLLGDRDQFRPGERFGEITLKIFKPLLLGPLRKYRAIHADTVAKGLIAAVNSGKNGIQIWESDAVQELVHP